MFMVRKELKVDSIESKIEKRALTRIGHVLRMPNDRVTKKVAIGWKPTTQRRVNRKRSQTLIDYWRTILKNAGVDPDLVELKVKDRIQWRTIINRRTEYIKEWETKMAEKTINQERPRNLRAQRMVTNETQINK